MGVIKPGDVHRSIETCWERDAGVEWDERSCSRIGVPVCGDGEQCEDETQHRSCSGWHGVDIDWIVALRLLQHGVVQGRKWRGTSVARVKLYHQVPESAERITRHVSSQCCGGRR